MDAAAAKEIVRAEIDRLTPALLELSHSIHAHPELNFEEHHAHEALTGVLDDNGIDVARGAYDMPTAFDARVGAADGPTVAVLCEYDALPGIGHACGHNIIGSAGLGAGHRGCQGRREALGGRVAILGTPAEEGGGGKEYMIRRGAFDDIDLAMMVHPADRDLRTMHTIADPARSRSTYDGTGRPCRRRSTQKGLNALDAAVLGYNAVAALRQHIRPDERIHGIFTEAGEKPNIVPSRAAAEWYVRSGNMASLEPLKERVQRCLQGGADASGCEMHEPAGSIRRSTT